MARYDDTGHEEFINNLFNYEEENILNHTTPTNWIEALNTLDYYRDMLQYLEDNIANGEDPADIIARYYEENPSYIDVSFEDRPSTPTNNFNDEDEIDFEPIFPYYDQEITLPPLGLTIDTSDDVNPPLVAPVFFDNQTLAQVVTAPSTPTSNSDMELGSTSITPSDNYNDDTPFDGRPSLFSQIAPSLFSQIAVPPLGSPVALPSNTIPPFLVPPFVGVAPVAPAIPATLPPLVVPPFFGAAPIAPALPAPLPPIPVSFTPIGRQNEDDSYQQPSTPRKNHNSLTWGQRVAVLETPKTPKSLSKNDENRTPCKKRDNDRRDRDHDDNDGDKGGFSSKRTLRSPVSRALAF